MGEARSRYIGAVTSENNEATLAHRICGRGRGDVAGRIRFYRRCESGREHADSVGHVIDGAVKGSLSVVSGIEGLLDIWCNKGLVERRLQNRQAPTTMVGFIQRD